MRIHASTLTPAEIMAAAGQAGDAVQVTYRRTGSRSRAYAYDVTLTGSSPHRPNGWRHGDEDVRAATWDEWGLFLAGVFAADADATVPGVYVDGVHFHWTTGGRFNPDAGDENARRPVHKRHRWTFSGEAVTGAYVVHECETDGCGAYWRHLSYKGGVSGLVDAWRALSGVNA